MKNFKTSIITIFVGAILYAICILILDHFGKFSKEQVFISKDILKTSITLSYWWNLAIIPFLLMISFYSDYLNEITGYSYYGQSQSVKEKLNDKRLSHQLTNMSLWGGVATWMYAIVLDFFLSFTLEVNMGPLSHLALGIIGFILVYTFLFIYFGFCEGISHSPETNGKSVLEEHENIMIRQIKGGEIKNILFMTGLNLGLVIRLMYDVVIRFFKAFFFALKKKPQIG